MYLDEESGVFAVMSRIDELVAKRYGPVDKVRSDLTLLPNNKFMEEIRKDKSSSGLNYEVIGWPRIDLWTEKYRNLFDVEADGILSAHGKFHLLSSSFGFEAMENIESSSEFRKRYLDIRTKAPAQRNTTVLEGLQQCIKTAHPQL